MVDPIEQILGLARMAPSGDNTQPVRFAVDPEARTIAVVIDPSIDLSPMNVGWRMSRMAAGASLENLIRAAEALGFAVELEIESGDSGVLAVVRLVGSGSGMGSPLVDEPVRARVTNRRVYDGRPVSAELLDRLRQVTPDLGGVSTHWITGKERMEPLARLMGESDATMFGEPSMRQAFLSNVRFDQPSLAQVEEGLSVGSLELGPGERLALGSMKRIPDRLFKLAGASVAFASKARRLVRSASGLCLVVAPDGLDATDVVVGRALQRAWLALVAEGLATQPMMSLLVLENVVDQGDRGLIEAIGRDKLTSLRDRLRQAVPEIAGGRPAWLLRFGHGQPPTGRTGRLPVEAVVTHARSLSPKVTHEPASL